MPDDDLLTATRTFLAATVAGLTDDQLDRLVPLMVGTANQTPPTDIDVGPYEARIAALEGTLGAIRDAATAAGFHHEAPLDEVIELLARRPEKPTIPPGLAPNDEVLFRLITAVRDAAGIAPVTQPWTFDEAFADTLTQLAGHADVPALTDLDPDRVAPVSVGPPTLEPTVTIPQTLGELNPFAEGE